MAHVRSYEGTRACNHCGAPYLRRRDEAKLGRGLFCSVKCSNEGRFGPVPVDDARVKQMYCEKNMTLEEIGAELGVNWKRIQRIIAAMDIPLRTGRRRNPDRRSPATYRKMVAAKKGEVIHHLNCVETDDRTANLVAVSRRRHAELHKQLELISAKLFDAGLVTFSAEAGYQMADRLKKMAL